MNDDNNISLGPCKICGKPSDLVISAKYVKMSGDSRLHLIGNGDDGRRRPVNGDSGGIHVCIKDFLKIFDYTEGEPVLPKKDVIKNLIIGPAEISGIPSQNAVLLYGASMPLRSVLKAYASYIKEKLERCVKDFINLTGKPPSVFSDPPKDPFGGLLYREYIEHLFMYVLTLISEICLTE